MEFGLGTEREIEGTGLACCECITIMVLGKEDWRLVHITVASV
jgi:hypothetical protein